MAKPLFALFIIANGNEFYDYTLHVSYDRCRRAVAKLNSYARQALAELPAAGDMSQQGQVQAAGWMTDCLTEARSAEILG